MYLIFEDQHAMITLSQGALIVYVIISVLFIGDNKIVYVGYLASGSRWPVYMLGEVTVLRNFKLLEFSTFITFFVYPRCPTKYVGSKNLQQSVCGGI